MVHPEGVQEDSVEFKKKYYTSYVSILLKDIKQYRGLIVPIWKDTGAFSHCLGELASSLRRERSAFTCEKVDSDFFTGWFPSAYCTEAYKCQVKTCMYPVLSKLTLIKMRSGITRFLQKRCRLKTMLILQAQESHQEIAEMLLLININYQIFKNTVDLWI